MRQSDYPNFHVSGHPLIKHKLAYLRDKNTGKKEFRELVGEIAMLLTYEAFSGAFVNEKEIETPLTAMKAHELTKDIVIVPILRAGIGMEKGILSVIPTAKVGHIGMYRDEETLQPHSYYEKLPVNIAGCDGIIADPMLATGGSAMGTAARLIEAGCKSIRFMCIVAAPEGVKLFCEKYPDIQVYSAALDSHLNGNGYIVPGLGDAGDRLFGTL